MILVGVAFYLLLFDRFGELKIPIAVYITCIVVMAWQGVSALLAKKEAVTILIALGSTFFIVSDALLALDKFHGAFPYSTSFVLATYWIAISCLGLSTTVK